MRAWMVLGLVGAILLASACRRSQGALSPTGYAPQYCGYQVGYHDRQQRSLMSPDWQLDNFIGGGDGFKPKIGSDYEAELFVDINDDGTSESMGSLPIYDLRFTHRRTAGVIWVRSVPLETGIKDKELRVLADGLVESISGGGYVVIQIRGQDYATNKDRRYAAKVYRRADATLGGKPAHLVTVDVSNVDRLRVDPDSVEARVTLVLARTGATRAYARTTRKFPLLLLASYANSPQDYAAAEPDFISLLSRIEVEGQAGFKAEEAAPSPVKAPGDSPERPAPAEEQDDDDDSPGREAPPETPDGGAAASDSL